jgi:hypothetical protein
MPASQSFIWVNKTRNSAALSNSWNEPDAFRQLHSHAMAVGYKTSRSKRSIKRQPFNLAWAMKGDIVDEKAPQSRSRLSPATTGPRLAEGERGRAGWTTAAAESDPSAQNPSQHNEDSHLLVSFNSHLGDGLADPFSSCSIELDAAAVDGLWYFENMWAQCAFKIPGCVGYGQAPAQPWEIASLIRACLLTEEVVHAYCLLAAASARMRYVHNRRHTCTAGDGRNGGSTVEQRLAHMYARRALRGLNQRLLVQQEDASTNTDDGGVVKTLSQQEATDILFLAAYETFCEDKRAPAIHLAAVRRLGHNEITNTFVSRLQANLELLATKH